MHDQEEIPLDWAGDVLPERATEEEMDEPMTKVFWSWDGPEEGEEPPATKNENPSL